MFILQIWFQFCVERKMIKWVKIKMKKSIDIKSSDLRDVKEKIDPKQSETGLTWHTIFIIILYCIIIIYFTLLMNKQLFNLLI